MKKCPFCAEEIQDAAIRCRHCKADLVEHASAQPQPPNQEKTAAVSGKSLMTLPLVILGGYVGYKCASSVDATAFKYLVAMGLGTIGMPIAWAVGWEVGKVCQPNFVTASDAVQLGVKRIGYFLMPMGFAVTACIATIYGIATYVGEKNIGDAPAAAPAGVPTSK